MRTRFPLIQTFFPNQVGKSGLVIPRMVLTVGEVEEGFRRKAFLFFFFPPRAKPVTYVAEQTQNK